MEVPNVYSKQPDFQKLIPFVSPSEDIIKDDSKPNSVFNTGLSGVEVSRFYDSLISTPPVKKSERCAPSLRKKSENHENLCSSKITVTPGSIFRFAQEGDIKRIQECIAAGCSVDQRDAYGWTPLMCATCEGHSAVVEYLMKQGANHDIKCNHGMSPLDIAIKEKHAVIIKLLQADINLAESTGMAVKQLVAEKEKYCESCKVHFKAPISSHERSIAHLLNTKKTKLSTFYHIPENNKGFQLMLKSGWNKNKGLGLNADGRKFPIKTVLKQDRSCIGKKKEVAKVTHFNANDYTAVKSKRHIPIRTVREKTLKKMQQKRLNEITRRREINFRRQFYSDF